SPFVSEFCQLLSRHGTELHFARSWLEQRLGEQGLSIEHLIHLEGQNQAADQVSVSHSIASLRLLSGMDWKQFVEALSRVDEILLTDPAGIYGGMDFATRDRYRHSVEMISRHGDRPEEDVAQLAVEMAADGLRASAAGERAGHVGYYLIGEGREALGRGANVRWPLRSWVERSIHFRPLAFYAGGILVLTLLAGLGFASRAGLGLEGWRFVLLTSIFLLCASQLAVGLMNWFCTFTVNPQLLPRLDYSGGIPDECRTMVVVPTMLTSPDGVERLIETLEVHYLANRDSHLHFALLTDFRDAVQESLPDDAPLLNEARCGIEMLNRKYSPLLENLFFLFHRPRRWNPGEGVWMGYERKRGKLHEFNSFLRSARREGFSDIVGETSVLSGVKYVITLDTDTQLPRDAAWRLVGTMAHPLNRPVFDKTRGVVTEGYSILQPRVGVSLPSARRSWFVRLFAGDSGIDPYTREVSDVYQDIFQEGSFVGKGIYDVDAFQRALDGRFPENTILSHDLLESCHARSALVSDVQLYEDYPSCYHVDVARRHRWIRGDWQITQWLLPRVPGPDASRIGNPLSGLSYWKIFDNLRRSLIPVALLLLLLATWLFLPEHTGLGPLLVFAILLPPGVLATLVDALRKPSDLPWLAHLRLTVGVCGRRIGQSFVTLAFLPYDAFISLDAIGRTLVRLLVTHKQMLQWQTSGDVERGIRISLVGFHAKMWIAPIVAVATGLFLAIVHPHQLLFGLPFVGIWLLAPGIAWWISQPIESMAPDLTVDQLGFLRRTARKTWYFFETFVNSGENWLPPDNFQEVPVPTIAFRTSPTNMGLALLANLAARDLGYLSVGGLVERTRDTLATMQALPRYRGHFYNWYDTRSLEPLHPHYVSSVDSGNLAGHLLTLGSGLREQADEKCFPPHVFAGLGDTVRVLRDLVREDAGLAWLDTEFARTPAGLRAAHSLLGDAVAKVAEISALMVNENEVVRGWARTLQGNCADHLKDVLYLGPWLALPRLLANGREGLSDSPADGEGFSVADAATLETILVRLDEVVTLRELSQLHESLCPMIEAIVGNSLAAKSRIGQLVDLSRCIRVAGTRAAARISELELLALQSDRLAAMDFTFLFDPARGLFSIGFNVTDGRMDSCYYDLLASEARLCSYVAIALGQVPQDHWFSMGRLLVASKTEPLLVSWSGSMFEYLMPQLVMPTYENTLLDHTCRMAVREQIDYGKLHGIPWGISESGYHRTDVQLNYQYRAFGVPGLGLKRGLADDLVIAPYASAMALGVAPRASCENLQRLSAEGREGAYGFYEAVDYTPSRLPPERSSVTVRSFMVHHQGMALLGLVNILGEFPMQRRFLGCPMLRAADLLLQERVPKSVASVFIERSLPEISSSLAEGEESVMRVFRNPNAASPDVHLLSNGRYHVMISSAGGGYSRWGDLAVTRWREDAIRDCWGAFIYLRDPATGEFWSTAYQPTLCETDGYEAIFTQSRAEFRQRHQALEIYTQISVSPEDDVELRRVTLTNRSSEERVIELTSFAEVVLASQASDMAHPAFSNLFVQTEFEQPSSAILCTRRARSVEENPPWLLHLMVSRDGGQGEVSCETDRSKFVGRGGTLANPAAMQGAGRLSNTVGSVLDPVVSLRRTVTLPAQGSVIIDLVLGMTATRETAMAHVEKYQSLHMVDRAFDLAWTHNQVTLHHLDVTGAEAQMFGRLAGPLVYATSARRANSSILLGNRRGQNGLWSYGISGDVPILLLYIRETEKIDLVRQLVRAHSYWRMKGLTVDLVILHEDISGYRQSLQDNIIGLISSGSEAQMLDKPGGIFVRSLDLIPSEDRALLLSSARVVLDDVDGTLAEQMEHQSLLSPAVPALLVTRAPVADASAPLPARELHFANGLGGFTSDGHEYVITLERGRMTPAPWANVLANPNFGTVVTESGSAYTWVENCHEFRITPWNNDPVQDPTGEALYIRDEQTGQFWSPTPLPARGMTPYVVRHGFGYSVFEHTENGISSELWVYVATDASVKFTILKLRNVSGRARRLSVTGYWEWVLGEIRQKNLMHVQTEVDLKTGALLVRNHSNTEFPNRIVFLDVNDTARTLTGDRKEFIGRNGSLAKPAAMKRMRLSGRVGAGLDPCGAMQVAFDLAPGQQRETSFRLGVGMTVREVQDLIYRFRRADSCRQALEGVWDYWNRTLGAVNVDTPDPSVNMMANGWLLYQTLCCRIWGRTGFYQSGGAYGFRDQLQDVMALVHAEPALTRKHLLLAAAHQFKQGDVQHWWHPPVGRGVRTHFTDDYLWLAHVTCRYVASLGDFGVLDEVVHFLDARPVRADEEAYYDLPVRSDESATLYQHCVRAIERGLTFGEHGLPLMGCGDWNDGMNRVGMDGRGESVWLAFFLYDVLIRFGELARGRQDLVFATRCATEAAQLQRNIEKHAWDGKWYRRAYFDNGEPLGSHLNEECQIDSLPQSWSVISRAGEQERSRIAMQSVNERLVRRDVGLIQLFDPPFDKSQLNPGYIKGYIPGVRENGGQYTHGAIWTAMAYALMGEGERAWELFDLLNPVHHGGTAERIAVYKVEPYVVAADVYAVAPHTGRGGWTWYTGSAGWMYRLLVENLLGVHLEGEQLRLAPALPRDWPSFKIHYRYRQTVYHIVVSRLATDAPPGNRLTLDGRPLSGSRIPLVDDEQEHFAELQVP
ncbi:cyclic beta 1-2 glucan synthetase, partial [bacterium]|nr:cyclic beta 1-2 glucan synthetase [bacterium]